MKLGSNGNGQPQRPADQQSDTRGKIKKQPDYQMVIRLLQKAPEAGLEWQRPTAATH